MGLSHQTNKATNNHNIALTHNEEDRIMEAGCDDYLSKPVKSAKIVVLTLKIGMYRK
jgi:CheY-like chemotaxis protein